jgi:hypothetical protein
LAAWARDSRMLCGRTENVALPEAGAPSSAGDRHRKGAERDLAAIAVALDEVGAADEARDEACLRPVVKRVRASTCSMRPWFITAMRSEVTMASAWSWVT